MQNLYPIIGGAEQSADTLIKELRKRGHTVNHICQSNYDESLLQTIQHHDVIVTQLNWTPMVISKCEQYNKKCIVFIRSMENVCRIVNLDPRYLSICEQKCKSCKHRISGYEEQGRALLKADLIIGNSKWTSKMLKEEHGLNSEYIYPFIDFKVYQNIELSKPNYIAMNKWSWPDGTEIFLDIARIMPQYNFKIVGYESVHSDLGLPKNVVFTGVSENIDDIYKDVLVWLYPNLHGTFGRVVIEAQLAGIPVVGAGRGPVLADEMTPYIVKDYHNAKKWKTVILDVIRDNKPPLESFDPYKKETQVDKFIKLSNNL